jgi:hypothetical protein
VQARPAEITGAVALDLKALVQRAIDRLDPSARPSRPVGEIARAVENELYGSLDAGFAEDAWPGAGEPRPGDSGLYQAWGHDALKRETSLKVGLKNKRSRAGWDSGYLAGAGCWCAIKSGALALACF